MNIPAHLYKQIEHNAYSFLSHIRYVNPNSRNNMRDAQFGADAADCLGFTGDFIKRLETHEPKTDHEIALGLCVFSRKAIKEGIDIGPREYYESENWLGHALFAYLRYFEELDEPEFKKAWREMLANPERQSDAYMNDYFCKLTEISAPICYIDHGVLTVPEKFEIRTVKHRIERPAVEHIMKNMRVALEMIAGNHGERS